MLTSSAGAGASLPPVSALWRWEGTQRQPEREREREDRREEAKENGGSFSTYITPECPSSAVTAAWREACQRSGLQQEAGTAGDNSLFPSAGTAAIAAVRNDECFAVMEEKMRSAYRIEAAWDPSVEWTVVHMALGIGDSSGSSNGANASGATEDAGGTYGFLRGGVMAMASRGAAPQGSPLFVTEWGKLLPRRLRVHFEVTGATAAAAGGRAAGGQGAQEPHRSSWRVGRFASADRGTAEARGSRRARELLATLDQVLMERNLVWHLQPYETVHAPPSHAAYADVDVDAEQQLASDSERLATHTVANVKIVFGEQAAAEGHEGERKGDDRDGEAAAKAEGEREVHVHTIVSADSELEDEVQLDFLEEPNDGLASNSGALGNQRDTESLAKTVREIRMSQKYFRGVVAALVQSHIRELMEMVHWMYESTVELTEQYAQARELAYLLLQRVHLEMASPSRRKGPETGQRALDDKDVLLPPPPEVPSMISQSELYQSFLGPPYWDRISRFRHARIILTVPPDIDPALADISKSEALARVTALLWSEMRAQSDMICEQIAKFKARSLHDSAESVHVLIAGLLDRVEDTAQQRHHSSSIVAVRPPPLAPAPQPTQYESAAAAQASLCVCTCYWQQGQTDYRGTISLFRDHINFESAHSGVRAADVNMDVALADIVKVEEMDLLNDQATLGNLFQDPLATTEQDEALVRQHRAAAATTSSSLGLFGRRRKGSNTEEPHSATRSRPRRSPGSTDSGSSTPPQGNGNAAANEEGPRDARPGFFNRARSSFVGTFKAWSSRRNLVRDLEQNEYDTVARVIFRQHRPSSVSVLPPDPHSTESTAESIHQRSGSRQFGGGQQHVALWKFPQAGPVAGFLAMLRLLIVHATHSVASLDGAVSPRSVGRPSSALPAGRSSGDNLRGVVSSPRSAGRPKSASQATSPELVDAAVAEALQPFEDKSDSDGQQEETGGQPKARGSGSARQAGRDSNDSLRAKGAHKSGRRRSANSPGIGTSGGKRSKSSRRKRIKSSRRGSMPDMSPTSASGKHHKRGLTSGALTRCRRNSHTDGATGSGGALAGDVRAALGTDPGDVAADLMSPSQIEVRQRRLASDTPSSMLSAPGESRIHILDLYKPNRLMGSFTARRREMPDRQQIQPQQAEMTDPAAVRKKKGGAAKRCTLVLVFEDDVASGAPGLQLWDLDTRRLPGPSIEEADTPASTTFSKASSTRSSGASGAANGAESDGVGDGSDDNNAGGEAGRDSLPSSPGIKRAHSAAPSSTTGETLAGGTSKRQPRSSGTAHTPWITVHRKIPLAQIRRVKTSHGIAGLVILTLRDVHSAEAALFGDPDDDAEDAVAERALRDSMLDFDDTVRMRKASGAPPPTPLSSQDSSLSTQAAASSAAAAGLSARAADGAGGTQQKSFDTISYIVDNRDAFVSSITAHLDASAS